jgi:hypothetical protein
MTVRDLRDDRVKAVNPPEPLQDVDSDARPNPTLHRLGWIAALTFAVVMLGLWIWLLFIYDPGLKVDELADQTFPQAAEEICADYIVVVESLPRAESTDDPVERSEVITEANAQLTAMVADLRAELESVPEEDRAGVAEWIDDWEVHIEDRQEHADELRTDPTSRFSESVKGQRQISRAIDGFAQVNRMESCETPGDVG